MYRGSGRRVDTALDSPHAFKGCIMRSSPFPCLFISFFLFRNQVRLHSPHCRCCKCVYEQACSSDVSHQGGYFGLQWVQFRWYILWLKHIPFTRILKNPGDARCMVFLVRLFCCCFMSSVAFSKKGTGLLIFVALNRSDPRINSQ